MHQEHRAAKQNSDPPVNDDATLVAGSDVIDDLQQGFQNLDLGDEAHQLQALISEMTDFDPESLQFEDEPKTWEEAKSSADVAQWKEGYQDELK
jgi:hypothetical protein